MKTVLILLLLLVSPAMATRLPDGVCASIDLKGGSDGRLSIRPSDTVIVSVTLSNTTASRQSIRIYEHHPYHGKLPVATDCRVRDLTGGFGEFWSQYTCWSTTFEDTDERNQRVIDPGGTLVIEVPLHEVLSVPAGGEPEGWMWRRETGYRLGETQFLMSFAGTVSRALLLDVSEITQHPEDFSPISTSASDEIRLIDYIRERDGVLHFATFSLIGDEVRAKWIVSRDGTSTTREIAVSNELFRDIWDSQNLISDFQRGLVGDSELRGDASTHHVIRNVFSYGNESGTRVYLVPARSASPHFDAWLKNLGCPER